MVTTKDIEGLLTLLTSEQCLRLKKWSSSWEGRIINGTDYLNLDQAIQEFRSIVTSLHSTRIPGHLDDVSYYILDENGNPKKVANRAEWNNWDSEFGDERILARTIINEELDIVVNTVFLGYDTDHPYFSEHEHLWGTCIFGFSNHGEYRYSSKEEALKGHEIACTKAKRGLSIFGKYMQRLVIDNGLISSLILPH